MEKENEGIPYRAVKVVWLSPLAPVVVNRARSNIPLLPLLYAPAPRLQQTPISIGRSDCLSM